MIKCLKTKNRWDSVFCWLLSLEEIHCRFRDCVASSSFVTIANIMEMQEETNNTTTSSTPMVHIWMIVFGSMFFVAIAGVLWHEMEMTRVRVADTYEANEIRRNIGLLENYIAAHQASTTSISGTTTNQYAK